MKTLALIQLLLLPLAGLAQELAGPIPAAQPDSACEQPNTAAISDIPAPPAQPPAPGTRPDRPPARRAE